MRSTADLIAELNHEAETGDFALIALAVVFEDGPQLVVGGEGTSQARLDLLNALINKGGQPIGFVCVKIDANKRSYDIASRPLSEFGSDRDALDLLKDIAMETGELFMARWRMSQANV
jgi:hypothetical protein